MADDVDFFDIRRELLMERKEKYGHREDSLNNQAISVKYIPVDTGEAYVGG